MRVSSRENILRHTERYIWCWMPQQDRTHCSRQSCSKEVTDITGIVLTKLDGTAKGGIVVAIKSELQIPVRYIGVGGRIHDLQKFDAAEFAGALFGREA